MKKTTVKKEYDMATKSKVMTGLALRILVASYIVYLAWKLLSGMRNGSSSIPGWGIVLICIIFAVVAVAFCVYAWKTFKKALKAAEVTRSPEPLINSAEPEIPASEQETGIPRESKASDIQNI